MDPHELSDARHLLGMRERGVWLVAGAFICGCWLAALTSAGTVTNVAGPIAAAIIYSAATIALIAAEGDPLPVVPTVLLAATGPVCSTLVLSVSSAAAITSVAVAMSHGASAAIYAFMVVRGRRLTPWIGFLATVVVFATWGAMSGAGAVASVVQVAADVAPLLMAMLFSYTLNPTAQQVFSLRQQTTVRVAQLAASRAAADERTRQVRHLDSLARPLLELIASGAELSAQQRLDCEILEAHLRDRLRAPLMSELDLDDPAYQARLRGVDVVLIDDSTTEIARELRERIAQVATNMLDAAHDGEVFVRVSPSNRSTAASVLHRPAQGPSARVEVDAAGGIRSVV
ncbi:hypothetical protein [Gordonia aichiensis]|uniref:Two-component histidine kinase n=1 Tax=Gordonia aichiensis NBRC 108223 TaxID=1220583 RepID=L7KGH1_9ACTN|nr:hypothetical protein [Gordonia aichiensis]GAC47022.1 hypothetical protein GOACH_03_00370 [Gordonia aichiensis NBRC 108223]